IIGTQYMTSCEMKKNEFNQDDINGKFTVPEEGGKENEGVFTLSNGSRYSIIVKSIDLPVSFVETERHYKSRILSIATIKGLYFILLDESKSFDQLKHVLYVYDEEREIVRKVDMGKSFVNDYTSHLEVNEENVYLRSDGNRNPYKIDIEGLTLHKSDEPEKPFYQDKEYIVTTKDLGEWGGTMFFEHRKTGAIHEVRVDGPIIINKLDNAYIVSSTLRHMMSRSSILKIINPRSLHLFDLDDDFTNFMGSSHREGSEELINGDYDIGTSFIRDNTFYHLYEEDGATNIGVLEEKDSDNNDLYSPYALKPLYRFTSNINARLAQVTEKDEHLLINQSTHESMGGMILVKANSIVFYYLK
nr:hypothetical protein [Ignavibacteriota bacterium]